MHAAPDHLYAGDDPTSDHDDPTSDHDDPTSDHDDPTSGVADGKPFAQHEHRSVDGRIDHARLLVDERVDLHTLLQSCPVAR